MQSMRLALVYNVDPTSPKRQSQQPHLRQSSCQNKSNALSRNRSVMRFPQFAHSLAIIAVPPFRPVNAVAVTVPPLVTTTPFVC